MAERMRDGTTAWRPRSFNMSLSLRVHPSPSMAETSPLILFGLQTDGSNNLKKEGNLV
jgi:hypothetical protein